MFYKIIRTGINIDLVKEPTEITSPTLTLELAMDTSFDLNLELDRELAKNRNRRIQKFKLRNRWR